MLKDKKFYPWMVVGMLVVVSLLNYLDRQMLATMRPFIMVDIKELESITNFGRLMAIFLWIYAFMSPISGMIADRLNRKWLIVISLFVWSTVTLMMGYVHDISHLYILRALMGVSGVLTSGIYLGQAIGGFGATVAAHTSWQFTFHSFGMIGIIYSFVLITLLHEKKTYVVQAEQRRSIKENLSMTFKGLAVLFSNIAFWVMLYYFAALNLPGWTTKNWLPTMVSDTLNMDMEFAGPLSTTTLALSSFVGVFLGGFISDKWVQKNMKGRVYTSATGLSLIVPALLMMVYGNNIVFIVAGAILFGLGFGMYDTNNMPILCQFIPSRYRATGYGLMNFVGIAAGAIITNELGKAFEANYKDLVFLIMILSVCLSIFLQLKVLNPKTMDMTDELMAESKNK